MVIAEPAMISAEEKRDCRIYPRGFVGLCIRNPLAKLERTAGTSLARKSYGIFLPSSAVYHILGYHVRLRTRSARIALSVGGRRQLLPYSYMPSFTKPSTENNGSWRNLTDMSG